MTDESIHSSPAPGPRGTLLLGSLAEFRAGPIALFEALQRDYGDIVRFRLGPREILLLCHPQHIRYVLKTNHRNYGKQTRGIQKLKGILGDGLLTADGPHWLRQRRIASPTFRPKNISVFAQKMTAAGEVLLGGWSAKEQEVITLDVHKEMMEVTLRIAGDTLFSADVTKEAKSLADAMSTAMEITQERVGRLIDLPESLPTPSNRRFRSAMSVLDTVVLGMIEARRSKPGDYTDLLSMLLEAKDEETGEGMDDAGLKDEVLTLLLAGHETTANALSWLWYLLSENPAQRERLHAELDQVLGGRCPGLADLAALQFTEQVIREALRLMPPGWLFGRAPIEDDVVGGHRVAAGTLVMISPYITHRHPEFWPEPERFDPDRFLPTETASRDPFSYFPFSGGPRSCIGSHFAMMEMKLLVAQIAGSFTLDLVPGHPIELEQLVTLRPKHGLQMTIRRRTGVHQLTEMGDC